MVREGVGRLPVIERATGDLVGIISRSDLLAAHEPRLNATEVRATPIWTAVRPS
jgi:CBS domain-containing protein